jgi:carboxymethylenebutenolidase
VLALWGGADQGIEQVVIDAFERALERAEVEHRSVIYPGAPHSFFDRKALEFAEESEDAWREMLGFMRVG